MKKENKLKKYYKSPRKIIEYLYYKLKLNIFITDELSIKISYKLKIGKTLNLKNPITFNEKLQWLKLNDRNPQHTINVDKFLVREYVKSKIGEEYLIPILDIYNNTDEIDFDSLPNQFVLKCNHNSGTGMCICNNKSILDIKKIKKELNKGLKENYYKYSKEWPYKDVPKKIICEKYMSDGKSKELIDYKFLSFNGKVKIIFTVSNRNLGNNMKVDFFDVEWNHLPFTRHYPSSNRNIKPPINLNKMIELATILSENETFVRVDFYDINGDIFFGELTYFPGSGFEEFSPEIWDKNIGDMIELPLHI